MKDIPGLTTASFTTDGAETQSATDFPKVHMYITAG